MLEWLARQPKTFILCNFFGMLIYQHLNKEHYKTLISLVTWIYAYASQAFIHRRQELSFTYLTQMTCFT